MPRVHLVSIFFDTEKKILVTRDVCPSSAEIILERGYNNSTGRIVFKFVLNIDIWVMHV